IVEEICDSLFWKIDRKYSGKFVNHFDGDKYYLCIPKLLKIKDGFVLEKPCPGFYNHGEFQAIAELNKKSSNPVLAVFSGHDHSNSFRVRYKNIDLVNTASAKPAKNFMKNINRGCRIITLNENKITKYKTYTLTYAKLKICLFFRSVSDLWHVLNRSHGSSSTGCISYSQG
ncbi:MAG: hypothetical protein MJ215_07230, partial [Spirochaetia bacterium]|nr:hypothetical protein [Spirochaetia bacterium]